MKLKVVTQIIVLWAMSQIAFALGMAGLIPRWVDISIFTVTALTAALIVTKYRNPNWPYPKQ